MRRRRQKNTLLPKMLGLAVIINAVLLPILAQFGVFKSIGGRQRLTSVEMVKLPPPEKRHALPKKTPKKLAARPHLSGRKAAARPAAMRRAPSGSPPVKVVAAGPAPGGSGGEGDAGITPSDSGPTVPPAEPPASPPAAPNPPPAAPVAPPNPPPSTAPPPVVPPPSPHVPTLTAAVPVDEPRPTIPDDLRDTDLSATFVGLFSVHVDGTATVRMVSSTGNAALDSVALESARRWKFRPAMRDGQAVESYLRLKIEFDVSG